MCICSAKQTREPESRSPYVALLTFVIREEHLLPKYRVKSWGFVREKAVTWESKTENKPRALVLESLLKLKVFWFL